MAKKNQTLTITTLGTGPTNQGTMSLVPTPSTLATHPQTDSEPRPGTGLDQIAKPKRQRRVVTVTNRQPTPEELAAIQQPPAAKPAKEPKAAKGLDREKVLECLRASGLALHEKGSQHWGGQLKQNGKTLDGCRLVLPPSKQVTRLYVYNAPGAQDLAGWLPEEKRPGKVTHQADNPSWDQFMAILRAVADMNGLALKKDGTPVKRSTTSTGEPRVSGGARSRKAKANQAGQAGTSEGTVEVTK